MTILATWPRMVRASPVPLNRRQDLGNISTSPDDHSKQAMIAGIAAGLGVAVLVSVVAIMCFRRPKHRGGLRRSQTAEPLTIKATTTTTITSHSVSRSGSSDSSNDSRRGPGSMPMTRITAGVRDDDGLRNSYNTLYHQSHRLTNDQDIAGPSTRRPPPARTRQGGYPYIGSSSADASGSSGLSPLPEVSPPPTSVTTLYAKSDLADRRGQPQLQSIQVPTPPSSSGSSDKGKGKERAY